MRLEASVRLVGHRHDTCARHCIGQPFGISHGHRARLDEDQVLSMFDGGEAKFNVFRCRTGGDHDIDARVSRNR
ncbi:MAG: hypothetical protein EBV53_12390 [Proteobacteria bacterium]|nr:hypothetical protein [Pseudomonadota bacterium]